MTILSKRKGITKSFYLTSHTIKQLKQLSNKIGYNASRTIEKIIEDAYAKLKKGKSSD